MVSDRYESLLIDPETDRRLRLKEAAKSLYQFGSTVQAVGLEEVNALLQGDSHFDVVFVSSRFDSTAIAAFIAKAKEAKAGRDAAYVLVMGAKDQGNSTIATSVMQGADGFLFEPYSVDALLEITRLADRVKKDRARIREQLGITLLLREIITQLDLFAFLRRSGYEGGITARNFKEMCGAIHGLDEESRKSYYELAVKMFGEAPLPKDLVKRKVYTGKSERIRKQEEEKLNAEIQAQLKQQAG